MQKGNKVKRVDNGSICEIVFISTTLVKNFMYLSFENTVISENGEPKEFYLEGVTAMDAKDLTFEEVCFYNQLDSDQWHANPNNYTPEQIEAMESEHFYAQQKNSNYKPFHHN